MDFPDLSSHIITPDVEALSLPFSLPTSHTAPMSPSLLCSHSLEFRPDLSS